LNSTLELSELNTMIGRLFMSGMPGTKLDSITEELIANYCLNGIILFKRNIENPIQLATLCNDLQEASIKYHGIPLFIALDQEGGRVARLQKPFTVFPGNTAICKNARSEEKAREFATITAKEMSLVGLNMNMAPVLDVIHGEPEKHLQGRSFGVDPVIVASLGSIIIKGLQSNNVMAVAKHFPGLGKTSQDPHHQLPIIDIPEGEIQSINLPPFKEAIQMDVSAIMTSHAIYPNLDPERPASLSKIILTDLLRNTLDYKGLIITDDLEMGAIVNKWGVTGGALASFDAGADILLICEDQNVVVKTIHALKNRFLIGKIHINQLQQSIKRIKIAKSRFLDKQNTVLLDKVKGYFNLKQDCGSP